MLTRHPAAPTTGVDIGHPEKCCANTNYCYVKPDNSPWCCPIGSPCDSQCPATAYQCPTVLTRTVTATVTATAGASGAVVTSLATVTSSACCGRTCPSTSSFRCESQFGGGCCAYGQTCASGSSCIQTLTASSSVTGLLTPADPRCTATTQYACEDGGGCCDKLRICTIYSGTAACAPGSPTATDVNIVSGGGGLSGGAKAGIGVGVSVVGLGLAAGLAWFCYLRLRKGRRQSTGTPSRTSGRASGRDRGSERPSRGVRAMSDITSGSRATAQRGGATQDYFGPAAVAGPYTETETVASDGAASTPGRLRGVPLQAHSPSDIAAPVEIDSTGVGGRGHGHDAAAAQAGRPAATETAEGRFELYGSEMPSPPSPPMPSPAPMTPRSIASVSVMERSPGP